jgi:hypothetical protein
MGNAEALAQMRDAADVSVASENYATTSVFNDWHELIGTIKKDLDEGKSFDARKFSSDMVEAYRADNLEVKENFPEFAPWRRGYLTLTAVDNKKLGALVESWGKFTQECINNKVTDKQLFTAVGEAKNYPSGAYVPNQVFGFYDQIRDMGSIMDKIKSSEGIPEPVKLAADEVKKSLKDVIINEQHEGMGMEGSQGLTVWGPTNAVDVMFMGKSYNNEVPDFAQETGWSGRLKDAMANVPPLTLISFQDTYRRIWDIKDKLKDESLPQAEKDELNKQLEKEQEHTVELKRQMDFTADKPQSIFKSKEPEIDLSAIENIGEMMRDEILKNDGMK